VSWMRVSGPGAVAFSNATAAQTTASFPAAGTYVLQFTASNSKLASSATVTVTVNSSTPAADRAPSVTAGANQAITLPANAALAGQVIDAGSPSAPITIAWSKVSGPGTVSFGNAAAAQTSAAFATAGTYVLQIAAANPKLSASAQVTITVGAGGTQPPPSGGPIRINTGGAAYRDASGNSWLADQFFTGGTTFSTTGSIAYSPDSTLYNDQRVGDFTYRVPAANGLYSVVLGYAELTQTGVNTRLFNVYINGTLVAGNYDIVARSGAPKVALNQGITVDNRVGYIEVKYVSVVGQAVLNTLQLIPAVLY
jgi:Malectin domain